MTFMKKRWLPFVALVATFGMTGCSDSLFEVKNPGRILDADLNTSAGVAALVTGMSSDFSSSYDNLAFNSAILTDEMVGSGSYFSTGRYRRGLFDSEDADGFWNGVQRARWVAEGGLQRMAAIEGYTFAGNEQTARAYLFAGMANRWFGEVFCEVVFSQPYTEEAPGPGGEIDAGTPLPRSAAFERAIPALQAAVSNGTGDVATAAHGGLAQAYVGLGNWSSAMSEAAQVPTSFVFSATYSGNSGREENVIWNETHGRHEISAFGTLAAAVGDDSRTPFKDCSAGGCPSENGADGETIHYRQDKYPEKGSDIPLVKGTDMRLYEAENALLNGDLGTFTSKINEVRTFHGLAAIATVTSAGSITGGTFGKDGGAGGANPTSMTGWDVLDRERHLTLWLEGRRLWDLNRWDHPHLNGGGILYSATVTRRASCMPISDQECQVNDNVPNSKCITL